MVGFPGAGYIGLMASANSCTNDYRRVEKAIRHLDACFLEQPSLAELARVAGLSEFHFHRLFARWAGITPKQFLRHLTASYAKERLRESRSVLEASLDSGLSGPGRMHDLLVSVEAMSPGEYKARGRGLEIGYGFHPTPFGDCVVALSPRGLCGLTFLAGRSREAALGELVGRWPAARFRKSKSGTEPVARAIFGGGNVEKPEIRLLLRGSEFQLQTWAALLAIPPGALLSYGDVARAIGSPGAARAVGTAIGENPIAYLIPCHRVIRETGMIGEYRWGSERKRALIAWEGSPDLKIQGRVAP